MASDHPTTLRRLTECMEALGNDAPETMGAFMSLHEATTADGALPKSTKELIADMDFIHSSQAHLSRYRLP